MEDTKPKTFVFVLMPFAESFLDIYEVGIKPACQDAGAYCERVDEQIFVENILDRVYNQIAKADIIVAEMTGRNPNVFYEAGYAHALNKRAILLTQDSDDIPFDLKHYPHIIYGGKIASLKSDLEKRIRWCIENPKESLAAVDVNLEFYINGIRLEYDSTVNIPNPSKDRLQFEIGIHNLSNSLVDPQSFSLSLIVPEELRMTSNFISSITQLPDGNNIFNFNQLSSIFPDSWHSYHIYNPDYEFSKIKKSSYSMSLRLFSAFGPKDYHFVVSFAE